jgi:DNA-binding transcriptional ArsR family regulator
VKGTAELQGQPKMAKINEKTAEKVADVLKAIAHPTRLRIVEMLEGGEKCVGDIVESIGEKQSITSHQLNMMKDKGVLACRRDGTKVYYRIANENVIKVLHCVYDHCETE